MQKLKVRLLDDYLITTTNKRDGLIILEGPSEILTRQTVLVAGPNAMVVPGDEIEINTSGFQRKFVHPKNGIGPDIEVVVPPLIEIDKKEYLYLSSRQIKYIYTNE